MEKKIVTPNGEEYMTAVATDGKIEFRNFSQHRITIMFDDKVLDQLIPFLTEVNFWNKIKEKNHETNN